MPKQQTMGDDVLDKPDRYLISAATAYLEARDAWTEASEDVQKAKDRVLNLMHKRMTEADKTTYTFQHGPAKFVLEPGEEKLKVTVRKDAEVD